jgi:glycopeptide antibiotics resistance protein
MTTCSKVVLLLILSAYVLFILDLALLQFPARDPPTNLIPLYTIAADWAGGGRGFVVNFLGNIVAFMPIGLMPSLVRPRRTTAWHAGLFCLCLSATIEVGQYVSGRRVADVDDLILNTFGGLLGYSTLRYLRGRGAARAARDDARSSGAADEDRPTGS